MWSQRVTKIKLVSLQQEMENIKCVNVRLCECVSYNKCYNKCYNK